MRNSIAYIPCGLRHGALAGVISAEIYIVGLTLVILATTGDAQALFVPLMGQISGALPAAIIGGIVGMIIGLVFELINQHVTNMVGSALGLAIAGALFALFVLGLLYLGWSNGSTYTTPLQFEPSAVAILLPIMLLYLASGAWVGGKLSAIK